MIYVAKITYYDTVGLSVGTYYAATGDKGFATKPSDTPANTVFQPVLQDPVLLRRDIFDLGTVGGASRVGYGELVLVNTDGALDVFLTYALDGRALTVYVATSVAAFPGGWNVLFSGTMEEAEIGQETVRIRVRDQQVLSTKAFQPNKYLGTNVLPLGIEGLTSDLKGKPKPRVLGWVSNVEPVMVNTSKLIYQVHDGANYGAIRDVMAVYDAGALLTRDQINYTNQADVETNQPTPGTYRVWLAGGIFRLGASPYGQITCDVIQGLAPANRTAAQMYATICSGAGIGTVAAADLTALDAANSATLGIYVRDETTNQAVLDAILRTVGAWGASDNVGTPRIKRLEAPSGTPAFTIDEATMAKGSLRRIPMNSGGLPTYRVTVRGVPNYTIQVTGLAGAVNADRRARLAQPYQDVTVTDTAVQTAYALAPELIVETLYACLTQVSLEATRLQALYGVKRDRFEVGVFITPAILAAIDLGVVVEVLSGRFDMTPARLFRIIGYELDPTRNVAALTLWG